MTKKTGFLIFSAFLCSCGAPPTEQKPAQAPEAREGFSIVSDDFSDNAYIPARFTCDGDNISPALKWTGAPAGAAGFALTARDPDAPGGDFLHWAVAGIPPELAAAARGFRFPPEARELKNDFGISGYGGPCPPPGKPHRYVFTLYAVKAAGFKGGPAELEDFLGKHAIAKASLTGLYKRK